MAMAMRASADYSQNHLSKFDTAAAKDAIGLAREQVNQAHLDAKVLAKMKMSEFDNVRFLAQFFMPTPEGMKDDAHVQQILAEPNYASKTMNSVLDSLLPVYIESRLFNAMLQSAAAKHAATQKAMKSASDNADKLIKDYTRLEIGRAHV